MQFADNNESLKLSGWFLAFWELLRGRGVAVINSVDAFVILVWKKDYDYKSIRKDSMDVQSSLKEAIVINNTRKSDISFKINLPTINNNTYIS